MPTFAQLPDFRAVRQRAKELAKERDEIEAAIEKALNAADDELATYIAQTVFPALIFAKRVYGTRRDYRKPRLPLNVINRAFDDVIDELVGDFAHFLPLGGELDEPLTNTRLEGREEDRRVRHPLPRHHNRQAGHRPAGRHGSVAQRQEAARVG